MIKTISKEVYGYDSNNYGAHALKIIIGCLELYFSYDTIVGFRHNGELVVSENCWSRTTGHHLNYLQPDKRLRIKREVFEAKLNEVLQKHNFGACNDV